MPDPILDIQGLSTSFATGAGTARAVDSVDLSLAQGETLAVVGESGCGKTVLALSILQLVPDPPGKVTDGRVLYKGQDLLRLSEKQMLAVRGNEISMIFQEPMTSLNPVFRVGEQIAEAVRLHEDLGKREAWDRAVEMLDTVGIPNARRRAQAFPHELSGGMRQRVMIAMALACGPEVLLADEPTTALDVTIQAQVLDLMEELKSDMGGSVLLITHDLGVVARVARRVAVMYSGRVVETADVHALFHEPAHPYTRGLLASLPRPGAPRRMDAIPGNVPSIFDAPSGCRFHPRCPEAFERCRIEEPPDFSTGPGRLARCWLCEGGA